MFCFIAFMVYIVKLAHVQSPTVQQFFVCCGYFPTFYVSLLVFVIGSFYNSFCTNILMLFCLFTSSSIAVGLRIDALRPLEELIPGILAAREATSTVKGYNSHFQKWRAWAASFPGVAFFSCFCSSFFTPSY